MTACINKSIRFNTISIYLLSVAVCYGCLMSCNIKNQPTQTIHRRLVVQPFDDLNLSTADFVFDSLSNYFETIALTKPIPLPSFAYTKAKNRWRADSIIQFLHRRTDNGVITIGLTRSDISVTKGGVQDWGVLGLGFCPGKACVASSFRLSKTNSNMQLFKVAIHEIGHTEGLPHCKTVNCFMRDAEGRNRTDLLTSFCAKCNAYLKGKGWELL
jgi:archaemetzincin